MKRILEPELMTEAEQVAAYANADFEDPHSNFIEMLKLHCDNSEEISTALDFGCGPGDITFRLAEAFPTVHIHAVDGSSEMIKYAENLLSKNAQLKRRINHICSMINDYNSKTVYDIIYNNSLLHHLPDPMVLWYKIKELSNEGTNIFIMDLKRPASIEEARSLTEKYVCGEPEVLQNDFYNSLLAAFKIDEIQEQLNLANLNSLKVKEVSDRHLVISGRL